MVDPVKWHYLQDKVSRMYLSAPFTDFAEGIADLFSQLAQFLAVIAIIVVVVAVVLMAITGVGVGSIITSWSRTHPPKVSDEKLEEKNRGEVSENPTKISPTNPEFSPYKPIDD